MKLKNILTILSNYLLNCLRYTKRQMRRYFFIYKDQV